MLKSYGLIYNLNFKNLDDKFLFKLNYFLILSLNQKSCNLISKQNINLIRCNLRKKKKKRELCGIKFRRF